MRTDGQWLALLRDLDEPLPPREPFPPIESFLRPGDTPGRVRLDEEAAVAALRERPDLFEAARSWSMPRDFDRAAMQARFDRLAERLGEVYGISLTAEAGPRQDASFFGDITIPADVTATRAKRTRVRFAVSVVVSNHGGLVAIAAQPAGIGVPIPPVSASDRDRIEPVVTGLGYLVVPPHILDEPYDGPNVGPYQASRTWYERYFSYG